MDLIYDINDISDVVENEEARCKVKIEEALVKGFNMGVDNTLLMVLDILDDDTVGPGVIARINHIATLLKGRSKDG